MKHLSPTQRLPLGIPINIAITEKQKARGDPIILRVLSFSFSPASLRHKEAFAEQRGEAFRGGSRKFRKGWPGHLPAIQILFILLRILLKIIRNFKQKWWSRDPRLTPKSALGRSFVVKQRSSLSRPLRDDTKNGCEADFNYGSIIICSKREKHPSVLSPPPPPQPFVEHCHLLGPGGGVRKPLPGGEAFVNSSRSS